MPRPQPPLATQAEADHRGRRSDRGRERDVRQPCLRELGQLRGSHLHHLLHPLRDPGDRPVLQGDRNGSEDRSGVVCGIVGARTGKPLVAGGAGGVCGVLADFSSDWSDAAAQAANEAGCLKVEYSANPNESWKDPGVVTKSPWCLDNDPSRVLPDAVHWG